MQEMARCVLVLVLVMTCGWLAAEERLTIRTAPIPSEALPTGPAEAPKADLDGNGCADLAVGAPFEDFPSADAAGVVSVFYGTSTVFSMPGDFWYQDVLGGSTNEDNDNLGRSLAVGDFDGDGVYDLAIGVPDEDMGTDTDSGVVHVLYGVSGTGLATTGQQFWHQDVGAINGVIEPGDEFGWALAAGDFNNDGYDDLVVGVPREDIGSTIDAGVVQVIYGTVSGLDDAGDELWEQSMLGGDVAASDMFGYTLAVGDFDGDGYDDLAVGSPNEDLVSITNSGAVDILYGASGGLTTRVSNDHWHQDRSGIPDTCEEYDSFGSALAAGDFNDDGYDDLAIGADYEDVGSPEAVNAGVVHVLYGSYTGPTATGSEYFYQGSTDISNSAEDGDSFGDALATGDLDGDGYADLVIGARGESWSTTSGVGIIHVLYGDSGGIGGPDTLINQDHLTVNGNMEAGDAFGAALAVSDFDGDGYDDIAVGAPFEDIDAVTDAGMVFILYGTSGTVSMTNGVLAQGYGGSAGTYEEFDKFGLALAAIPIQTVSADMIFADDFESGNHGAWDVVAP